MRSAVKKLNRWSGVGPDTTREGFAWNVYREYSRGRLNRESVNAHNAWVQRGRTDAGRLDAVNLDASEMPLYGFEVIGGTSSE